MSPHQPVRRLGAWLARLRGEEGSVRARLVESTTGTFGLKVGATGIGFVSTVVLARLLGVAEYGAYTYALAWMGALVIPSTLGFRQLLVRYVAVYRTQGDWSALSGLLKFSDRAVSGASVVVGVGAAVVGWQLFEARGGTPALRAFGMALFALPFLALGQLRQAAMVGFHRVVRGQVPDGLIRPVLLLGLLVGVGILMRAQLSAAVAMALYVATTVVAFWIGTAWLRRERPPALTTVDPRFDARTWLGGALPLALVAGIQLVNMQADVLILGALVPTDQVGVYSAARRLADLMTFGLIALEVSIAPTIATLYAQRETRRLQRVVTRSTRILLGLSLPLVLVIVVFGRYLLLVFGTEFEQGLSALIVLTLGQVVNVALGPVGQIAIHTGHERGTALVVGVGAMLNVLLNVSLIPKWGTLGAAVASSVSLAAWNLMLTFYVYRRTGILSGPFSSAAVPRDGGDGGRR